SRDWSSDVCSSDLTIHIGPPPSRIVDAAKVVVEGVDAGLETARAGATAEEVEAAWQAVLRRNGMKKESRVGYSIGLAYPPDWGERTVRLRTGDTTELAAGMCFHLMSGVWLDDWGLGISEPCVVTSAGSERLCEAPRGPVAR